jgi:hypothetical protein
MKIRKINYTINYIHIITFNQYYRNIIAPYFSYENMSYAIDNENTIHESARLVFKNEGALIELKKENISFVYEGDVSEIKKAHPILEHFFSLYEKLKTINGYTKTIRHQIVISAVDIIKKSEYESIMAQNDFIKNPFGKLSDFGITFDFLKEELTFRFHSGSFSENDIQKYSLTPFRVEYNEDLMDNHGLMCQVTAQERISTSNFSRFKNLLKEGEIIISTYYGK